MASLSHHLRWLIALALFPQAPASAIAPGTVPAGRWVVDWGDIRCTLCADRRAGDLHPANRPRQRDLGNAVR